ncbi:MAG: hypothetical protein U9R08_07200 [Nanoarchaeota archaeon]|nr:hypothetical protein [Nanoarchaeota archaeon]
MKKRGQFSLEYLLVVGFALVIIIPITYWGYTSFQESRAEINVAAVNKIGYSIVNNAKNVYYLGKLSRVTLELNFPEGIENITVVTDDQVDDSGDPTGEILYYLEIDVFDSEILFRSDVPLSGDFIPVNYNPGIKNVKLQYLTTDVEIVVT